MVKMSGLRRWLAFALCAAAPLAVMVIAFAFIVFHILLDSELDLTADHSPEAFWRRSSMGIVIALSLAVSTLLALALVDRGLRAVLLRHSRQVVDALALCALVSLGATFAAFDMSFSLGDSNEVVLVALGLGAAAALPLLVRPSGGTRRLLAAVAAYGVFAGWVMVQRHIDWNMSKPFRRLYSQIKPGMTREQVEAIMVEQFPGKRPFARCDAEGMQYTLDPDDGRFNSEFIVIKMIDGKVSWADYLPD
jgi:hypothetical protein